MKWPVSAAAFEAVVQLLADERKRSDERRREARDSIQELSARYEALLERYHALRVTGGQLPQAVEPRPVDAVTQAIIAKSRGNPALYAHYGTYVATQRAMHVEEDEIANAILRGVEDNDGVPI